jgi:septum site-determining protein MinD
MGSSVVGVISGKGGVGKTTTVLNLSAALSQVTQNVIAIDADVKMSGLGLQLGMYYFPVTLNDVLKDTKNLYQAMYIHSSGLRIIPASLTLSECDISNLENVLNNDLLSNNKILVDGPPGLENNTLSVMKACKNILIVTEPEIPSLANLIKVVKIAKEIDVKPLGVIVNKYKRGRDTINKKEIEEICEVPILGVVPEDKNIRKSIFKKTPLVFLKPYSPASIEYRKIAYRLIGKNYEKQGNFIKKLLGRF